MLQKNKTKDKEDKEKSGGRRRRNEKRKKKKREYSMFSGQINFFWRVTVYTSILLKAV